MRKVISKPTLVETTNDENVFSILEGRAQRTPEDNVIEYKNASGKWESFTAQQFLSEVTALAKGLMARGIKKGDAVSILSSTRWEWTALDSAILSIGALTVPVYETNSSAQVKTIFNDSKVCMAFAEDDNQRDKIEAIRDQAAYLKDVYVIELGALDTLKEFGKAVSDEEFNRVKQSVKGDDLATIVYTSGSTGTPKGIELTHNNFVSIVYNGAKSMPDIAYKPNRRLLLFLPLAHVFARYMQFFCFAANCTLGLSSNLQTILADFQDFKPTFLLAVPRIFEKVYNAASQKAGTGLTGKIFKSATVTARKWSRAQQSDKHIPMKTQIAHSIYKKIVYKEILGALGGSVEYAVSGGAPLDAKIAHFFNGVGLPLLEGYGMTETTAPACVNPTEGYKIGTVGIPLAGMSFGIADDGELLISGPSVCHGYHNHPEITEEQIKDGWLHTGDLADIDDDGFITVTGRKKELIITAGGKNVSPGLLEASVMSSPVVSQCVVIGDRKPFIAALITLELNDTNSWLKAQGGTPVDTLDEARANPIVRTEVERAVDTANALVSRAESIRKFEILDDDFTLENGLITPSLKAKRQAVINTYQKVIDEKIYVPRKKKTEI